MNLKVTNLDRPSRLDKYIITSSISLSRSNICKLIESDKVLVNGLIKKNSYLVKEGDLIEIIEEESVTNKIPVVEQNLDILYEDDDLLVVNKQAGVVTHPSNGHFSDSLVSGLLFHSSKLSDINGIFRPGIVHRLDKDTSGVLIIAKNNQSHQILSDMMQKHQIYKEYECLVYNSFKEKEGTIRTFISRANGNNLKMQIDTEGKLAVTNFAVKENFSKGAYLSIHLETGRTHQIRLHMQYIGHPVVGDPLYGMQGDKLIDKQLLHAHYIRFNHPITSKLIEVYAPLPAHFQKVLDKFRNGEDLVD